MYNAKRTEGLPANNQKVPSVIMQLFSDLTINKIITTN